MKGETMSKENKEIEKLIKTEITRLNKFYKEINEEKRATAKVLIDNLAFMTIQMNLMKERINEEGVMIKYQNGENQWGYKKSPDVDTYNSFIKQSTTIVKQLTDLLPKDVPVEIDDGFEELVYR